MQVILTKEVLGLGDPGQIVHIKDGYGRNYLIPQGFAIEASKKNVALVEAEQKRIAAQMAREAEKVRGEAGRLEALKLTIAVKAGEGGKLYGSVTNLDLVRLLAEQGVEIDRRRIRLEAPIKKVGSHPFKIKLHPPVTVELAVMVEASAVEEAAPAETVTEAPSQPEAAGEETSEETPAQA